MKKLMMAIVCLMTTVISVNAQNGWVTKEVPADELTGVEAYTYIYFTADEIGDVIIYSDGNIKLITNDGIFDGKGVGPFARVLMGIYDENNTLLDKITLSFNVFDNPSICQWFEISEKRKQEDIDFYEKAMAKTDDIAKKQALLKSIESTKLGFAYPVVNHIKRNKGYVRFVAPRYASTSFDIKVPCMNN